MTDPLRALNLTAGLATIQAVLDVVSGIPGQGARAAGVPFLFPEVGAVGATMPNAALQVNTRARLTYDIVSIVGLGLGDELRGGYDSTVKITGDTYVPAAGDPYSSGGTLGAFIASSSGDRLITLQIKCEVTAASAPGPHLYLERTRTRLYLPTVSDSLEAAGMAINDIRESHLADYRDKDGRIVRCAMFEMLLNAADGAADDPATTIEIVIPDPTIVLP